MSHHEVDAAFDAYLAVKREATAATWPEWVQLELSMAQLKALLALHESGRLTVSALAERLGAKPPATSLLSDRLVHGGLVERQTDAADRRRVLLELTPAGQDLVNSLLEGRGQVRSWFEALEPGELAALERGLRALLRVARREVAQPAGMSR